MDRLDLQGIEQRLDKIIELLELRNSIEVARGQMRRGTIYFDDSEVFPDDRRLTEKEARKEYYPLLEPFRPFDFEHGGTDDAKTFDFRTTVDSEHYNS